LFLTELRNTHILWFLLNGIQW